MKRLGFLLVLVVGLSLGGVLTGLQTDDPFITYRYADNLITGQGFAFNPGHTSLITTAPLYALLLAAAGQSGLPIPLLSYALSVTAIVAGALALPALDPNSRPWASLVYTAFPLLWLTAGFETALFLAVGLWALVAVLHQRTVIAGLLLGVALGLRGDGVILLAIVLVWVVSQHGWPRLRERSWWSTMIGRLGPLTLAVLAVYGPLALWLTFQFGSPIPTTLQTKTAQAVSGLTGFYDHTSFIGAAGLLALGYWRLSPLWLLTGIATLFGAGEVLRAWPMHRSQATGSPANRAPGAGLVLVWSIAHFSAYALLGVAPYIWYFAPIVPGLAVGLGRALAWMSGSVPSPGDGQTRPLQPALRSVIGLTAAVLSLLPMATTLVLMAQVVRGEIVPPPPDEISAKVLPETKVAIYTRAGAWLQANTPPTATIGVTELGAIAYFARRPAVDFLGLTQPEHLAEIRHSDYLQALLRQQPDYLALTDINPIYGADPRQSDWFGQLYQLVQVLEDPAFWGSPVTIYARTRSPLPADVNLATGPIDLGADWAITATRASHQALQPGDLVRVQVTVRAGEAQGSRLLRLQGVRLDRSFTFPVVSRAIETHLWRPGEVDVVDFVFVTPDTAPPGGYGIQAGWVDSDLAVEIGRLKIMWPAADAPDRLAPLSSGIAVGVLDQLLIGCKTVGVPLIWQGYPLADDYTVFVHLRDTAGRVLSTSDGQPQAGVYPTSLWSPAELIPDPRTLALPDGPGTYDLVVGLYRLDDGQRLPVDPSPYRTEDGGVRIGQIRCP